MSNSRNKILADLNTANTPDHLTSIKDQISELKDTNDIKEVGAALKNKALQHVSSKQPKENKSSDANKTEEPAWNLTIAKIVDENLPIIEPNNADEEFILKLAVLYVLCYTNMITAALLNEVFKEQINITNFLKIEACYDNELIPIFKKAASAVYTEKFQKYAAGNTSYTLKEFKTLAQDISPDGDLYTTTLKKAAEGAATECKACFNSLAKTNSAASVTRQAEPSIDEKKHETPPLTIEDVKKHCELINRLDIFENAQGIHVKIQLNNFINEMLNDESCLAPKNRNNRFFGDCIGRPTTHKSKVDTLSETLKETRAINVSSLQEATVQAGEVAQAIADYRQKLFNACSFQNLRDLNAFLKKTFPTEYQSFDMPHDATKVTRKDIGPTLSTLHTALTNAIKNYIESTEPRAPKPDVAPASEPKATV